MDRHKQCALLARQWSEEHVTNCQCGGNGLMRLDVDRGHPLFGEPIPCICQRSKDAKERATRLRRQSGMDDEEIRRWSFEAFEPGWCVAGNGEAAVIRKTMRGIKATCEEYAKDPQGWLILQGRAGSGKTHLAYAIAGACLRQERPVYANALPSLFDRMREAFSQEGAFDILWRDLREIDVLVLDDLGAQRDTSWE